MVTTKQRAVSLKAAGMLAATAATAFVVAGCGSSSSGTSTASGSGAKTLTIANSQWLDPDRGAGLWKAMQLFQKSHPDVTVKQVAAPGPNYNNLITTQLSSGNGPDVMVLQDTLYQSLATAGKLETLPSTVTDGVTLNDTNEGAVLKGARLGVAWQQAPFGILYNNALFKKAGITSFPTTPEELITASNQIKAKAGAIGLGDQSISANTGSWTQQLDSWTFGYGGSWSANGKLTINTPENVAGVAAFVKVSKANVMQSQPYNPMIAAFTHGQVGMLTTCGCGAIGAAAGGQVKSTDIMVGDTPTPQHISFAQQLYVSVNKASKQSATANEFVKWLLSTEGQQALRTASGPDALATDVPMSDSYAAANPWAPQFAKIGKTAKSTLIPGFEEQTAQIMQIIVDEVQAAVVKGTSPAAAMAAAQQQVDAKF